MSARILRPLSLSLMFPLAWAQGCAVRASEPEPANAPAVAAAAAPAATPNPAPAPGFALLGDKKRFGTLSPDAAKALAAIFDAAVAGDLAALRPWMAEGFKDGFGGEEGADKVIDSWRGDPSRFVTLVKVIEQGCMEAGEISCGDRPFSASGEGCQLTLQRRGGSWRMSFLVCGD
jgi:hypothetical protein